MASVRLTGSLSQEIRNYFNDLGGRMVNTRFNQLAVEPMKIYEACIPEEVHRAVKLMQENVNVAVYAALITMTGEELLSDDEF